jgi:hypothetical protein
MGFVVPAVLPPAPRDLTAPAKIRASTMSSLLLRDRFTFATARRSLLQLWPMPGITSAAFTTIALTRVRLLATSNGDVRITVAGFNIEVRISMVSAGVTVTVACASGAVIGVLSGCTPGAVDTCIIEIRRTVASGDLDGLWLDDANLTAGDLP